MSFTMRTELFLRFAFAAILLAGCGASDGAQNEGATGGGAGGQGGATGSSESSTSATTSSGGAGGQGGAAGAAGSGTVLLVCDDLGACGNTGRGCVACAVDGPCADPYHICFNSDDCSKYGACFDACAGDLACIAGCDQKFSAGKDAYAAFFQCVICDQCQVSCGPMKLCTPP